MQPRKTAGQCVQQLSRVGRRLVAQCLKGLRSWIDCLGNRDEMIIMDEKIRYGYNPITQNTGQCVVYSLFMLQKSLAARHPCLLESGLTVWRNGGANRRKKAFNKEALAIKCGKAPLRASATEGLEGCFTKVRAYLRDARPLGFRKARRPLRQPGSFELFLVNNRVPHRLTGYCTPRRSPADIPTPLTLR